MSTADLGIAIGALALIAFVNWFFLGRRHDAVAVAATGGPVDVTVRVEADIVPEENADRAWRA